MGKAIRAKYGEAGDTLIARWELIAFGTPEKQQQRLGQKATVKDRLMAMAELADRGWGKAPQTVALEGDDGGPVRVLFGGRYRPDGHLGS